MVAQNLGCCRFVDICFIQLVKVGFELSKEMYDPECLPQSKLINNHSAECVSMCDISLLLLVTRLMNLASCGCGVIRSTNSHKHISGAFKTHFDCL